MKLGGIIAFVWRPLHSLCFFYCHWINNNTIWSNFWEKERQNKIEDKISRKFVPCTRRQTISSFSFQDWFESIFLILHSRPFRLRLSYPVSITCLYLCQSVAANTKIGPDMPRVQGSTRAVDAIFPYLRFCMLVNISHVCTHVSISYNGRDHCQIATSPYY